MFWQVPQCFEVYDCFLLLLWLFELRMLLLSADYFSDISKNFCKLACQFKEESKKECVYLYNAICTNFCQKQFYMFATVVKKLAGLRNYTLQKMGPNVVNSHRKSSLYCIPWYGMLFHVGHLLCSQLVGCLKINILLR